MRTYLLGFSGFQKTTLAVLLLSTLFASSVALADIISGLATIGSSNDVTITNLSIDKPADVAVGDVMIASIAIHDGNAVTTVTPPAGWTLIRRTDNETNISIASYWKAAGESEPANYIWSLSPQTRAQGGITRYSGVYGADPIDASAGNIGRGIVATTSPVTTTADSTQVIAVFALHVGNNNPAGAFSAPVGMMEKYDTSKAPAGPTIASFDAAQPVVGVSGSKTSNITGAQPRDWASQQIALRMIPTPVDVAVLVVGGGGGAQGGGGGGGGVIESTTTVMMQSYAITVGAGGGSDRVRPPLSSGENSSALGFTAIGGGMGAQWEGGQGTPGSAGGSGGGGAGGYLNNFAGGAGAAGQGHNGGSGYGADFTRGSGGGGGAGSVGTNATAGNGGAGGDGVLSTISGIPTYYGGGGGGSGPSSGGAGGLGGGGAGAPCCGAAGAVNTGGGGGGGWYEAGGSGGSGIVIISYPTGSMTATGGMITTSGGNTIHTFTSSGTLTVTSL